MMVSMSELVREVLKEHDQQLADRSWELRMPNPSRSMRGPATKATSAGSRGGPH